MTLALTHPGLDRAAGDLDTAAHWLADEASAADRRVRTLLDSGWSGDAADAFSAAWVDWVDGAHRVHLGLVSTRRLIVATHRDLRLADEDNGQRLDRVAARITDQIAGQSTGQIAGRIARRLR